LAALLTAEPRHALPTIFGTSSVRQFLELAALALTAKRAQADEPFDSLTLSPAR
jgi:hypothetical protein